MDEEEGFTVKDKRRFTDGAEPEVKAGEQPETQKQEQHQESDINDHPVEINFASFVFSIASSAFVHLGEEADPLSGETRVSLPMAKQTIDVLSILEQKTKGNLTQEEEHLLTNLLYALRMKYVEAAAKK